MASIPVKIFDPADLDDVTIAQIQQRCVQQEYRALKQWYKLMTNNLIVPRSSSAKRRMKRAQARNLDAQQWLRAVRAEHRS